MCSPCLLRVCDASWLPVCTRYESDYAHRSLWEQMSQLLERQWKVQRRNVGFIGPRIGQVCVCGCVCVCVWLWRGCGCMCVCLCVCVPPLTLRAMAVCMHGTGHLHGSRAGSGLLPAGCGRLPADLRPPVLLSHLPVLCQPVVRVLVHVNVLARASHAVCTRREVPIASEAKLVVYKQTEARFYSTAAYIGGVLLTHLPVATIECAIFGSITYFMCGFASEGATLVCVCVCVCVCVGSSGGNVGA